MNALIGLGILAVTAFLFVGVLPKDGKPHRLVGSQWEPYFAIMFVGGAALGIGLVTLWAITTLL